MLKNMLSELKDSIKKKGRRMDTVPCNREDRQDRVNFLRENFVFIIPSSLPVLFCHRMPRTLCIIITLNDDKYSIVCITLRQAFLNTLMIYTLYICGINVLK